MGEDGYVEVCAQAVPAHIGHLSAYPNGDPYGSFLPPPCAAQDPDECGIHRAVVFVAEGITKKGTARSHQEYENPLLVLTGEEYAAIRFEDLFERIGAALRERLGLSRTVAIFHRPDGKRMRFTEADLAPEGE